MLAFPAGVAAYAVLLVLVLAVAGLVRGPGALRAALTAHQTLPRFAVGPVALAVMGAETVLASVLLVGVVRASGPPQAGLAAAAVLFAGYGGYGWYVMSRGRGGPCGCGGAEVPMGRWVIARAFALAALAGFAAAAHDAVPTQLGSQLVVVLLAAATIGTLLWLLPAAMHVPSTGAVR
jgi:hypothetical protein